MKVGIPHGRKAVRLLSGFGGAMLLIGGEVPDRAIVPSSVLMDAVVSGDDAGARKAQELVDVARERIAAQQNLTEGERRVRLTALEDSMGAYVSMISRSRDIKQRDPDLNSAEAKTLLISASAVVDRLEDRNAPAESVSTADLVSDGMKGLALLGLISLVAGASLSFPVGRNLLRPFRALLRLTFPYAS